ncbi:MAG: EamA family transporter [Frankiales bacterium]|nr:EamA family transporter [Frankiales bacterium]
MTRRGWFLFGTMCVLWGIPYLLIKVAVEDLSPPVIVLARTGIGALVLLPIAAAKGYLLPVLRRWPWLLAFTALEIAGPWLLLTDAERFLTSSLTGLLIAAVPMVAAVCSLLLGDEDRLDRTRVLGLVVGMGGVAVLLGLDLGGQLRAAAELALVVIGYGTAPMIITRKLSDLPSLGVIAAALGLTAIGYAPVAAFSWPTTMPAGRVIASLLVLAIACTVFAFLVFFELIAEVGTNRATVFTFVNPGVALILGVVLLDERVTAGLVLGFPLVLLGCFLATRTSAPQALPAIAEP